MSNIVETEDGEVVEIHTRHAWFVSYHIIAANGMAGFGNRIVWSTFEHIANIGFVRVLEDAVKVSAAKEIADAGFRGDVRIVIQTYIREIFADLPDKIRVPKDGKAHQRLMSVVRDDT